MSEDGDTQGRDIGYLVYCGRESLLPAHNKIKIVIMFSMLSGTMSTGRLINLNLGVLQSACVPSFFFWMRANCFVV